jgi:hypothetical protein
MMNLISGNNAIFEDCHLYGSLSGTGIYITCWHLIESRLIRCSTDFSSDNALWGVMADQNSGISDCDITVAGTDEASVYGVSALNSHVSGSVFMASGKNAYGGHTGGNFTECTFYGLGDLNGYGFHVTGSLNANNCIFKGYTKDTENGEGIGISAGSHAKMLLHGITCPEETVHGYSQTGSLSAVNGSQGYYDGILYTLPDLPDTKTVVTYTDFRSATVLTQAEYDAIENPDPLTIYIIRREQN